MDLKAQLLKEAARLELQVNQLREAAKVLGAQPGTAAALPPEPRKRRKGSKRHPRRTGHRETCSLPGCGRGFLSYVRKYKGGSAKPLCSGACRAKDRRARLAAQAARISSKGVVLVAGDGVSKGL